MKYDEATRLVAKFLITNGHINAYQGLCNDLPGIETQTDVAGDLKKILNDLGGFLENSKSDAKEPEKTPGFTRYPNGTPKQLLPENLQAFVVALCFVEQYIVVSTAKCKLHFFTLEGELSHTVHRPYDARAAIRYIREFEPGSFEQSLIATASLDGTVAVFTMKGAGLATLSAHDKMINSLDVYKDYVMTAGYDYKINIMQFTESRLLLKSTVQLTSLCTTIHFVDAPREPVVLVGKQDSSKLFYYTITLQEIGKLPLWDDKFGSVGSVFCPMYMAMDNAGERLAIATDHLPFMRVIILDLKTRDLLANFNTFAPQDKYSISKICWSSDDKGIWVLGEDGIIRGIDVLTGQKVVELNAHEDRLRALAVSKNGALVSGGADKIVNLWNMN